MNRDTRERRRREPKVSGVVEHGRVERLTRDSTNGTASENFSNVNIVWSTFLSKAKDVDRDQR